MRAAYIKHPIGGKYEPPKQSNQPLSRMSCNLPTSVTCAGADVAVLVRLHQGRGHLSSWGWGFGRSGVVGDDAIGGAGQLVWETGGSWSRNGVHGNICHGGRSLPMRWRDALDRSCVTWPTWFSWRSAVSVRLGRHKIVKRCAESAYVPENTTWHCRRVGSARVLSAMAIVQLLPDNATSGTSKSSSMVGKYCG